MKSHFLGRRMAAATAVVLLAGQQFVGAQSAPGNNGAPSSQVQNDAASLITQRAEHKTDLFTGSFGYSVPIVGAPGRGGSEPGLALVYSSSGDNGWCGVGWVLDVGYIERNTKDGFPILYDASSPPQPIKQYDPAKGFMLNLFGKQMKLLTNSANEYRAEVDTEFLRCQFDTTNNRWDVYDKSGTVYRFGYTARVLNPNSGWTANYTGTFRWALEEIITATGERTTISYQTHSTSDVGTARVLYPNVISYNGHTNWNGYTANQTPTHMIQFGLQPRTDTRLSYRSGFRVVQDMRLTNIVCQANGQNVRRYALEYNYSAATKRSLLARVRTFGTDDTSELPAQSFAYQNKPLTFAPKVKWKDIAVATPSITERDVYGNAFTDLLDMDGDGLPDRVRWDSSTTPDRYRVQRNLGLTANGTEGAFATNEFFFGPTSGANFIADTYNNQTWSALNSLRTRIMDINGDGKPDRIGDDVTYFTSAGVQPYDNFGVQLNMGNSFSTDQGWPVETQGGSSYYYASDALTDTINAGRTSLLDINGDGIPDRVMMSLNAPWTNFFVQFGTGTGFQASRRFGPMASQGGTSTVLWSGVQSSWISMVDMNGDGLPDRVMLPRDAGTGNPVTEAARTNFVVEFNNGYGFEAQVWPNVDPQYSASQFNYANVQKYPWVGLLDLNGDGLPDRVMPKQADSTKSTWLLYRNTGAGFETTAVEISGIDIQNAVNVNNENWFGLQGVGDQQRMIYVNGHTITAMTDMNGDGLLDRVMADYAYANNPFSTPFYGLWVQTNSGPFPDLMNAASNGIGGVLTVAYKPSTAWDNREDPTDPNSGKLLPFPIQTVASVAENDGVNTNRTTTYTYSGGFYDGTRHEFAGFAKVTETDASNRQQVYFYHQGGGQDRMALGGYVDASTNLARFNHPGGVTRDGSGNIYVADSDNHVIRKITAAGVVTTIAGSVGNPGAVDATGTAARFNHPTGVVFLSGYLYVADTDNHSIRLINLTGNGVTTFAGSNGVAGSADNNPFTGARFYRPTSLAFNVAGTELYVADTGNHTIRKLSAAGMTTIGGVGIPGISDNPPRFNHPTGLTLDGGNNLFIADTDNHSIRQRTSAGAVSTLAGSNGVAGSADSASYLNARFRSPSAVSLSADFQTLYVADTGNQTIRKLVASGVTTVAGRVGNSGNVDGIGTNAFFNSPASLIVDTSGNVFIADTQNHLIRKGTPSGSFLAVTNFTGGVEAFGEYNDSGSFAKRGMPYRIETYGNDANLYHVVVNQVDQFGLGSGRWFPFVQQTFNFDYPGGGTPRITATRFAYNLSNGNLTNQIVYGEVVNANLTSLNAPSDVDASDTQYHHTSYAAISGNTNILNLPDTIKLTSDVAGTSIVREQKFFYNPSSGTVSLELSRICAGQYATNSYPEYDDYGLPVLTVDPVGVQTKISAFDALHIYPNVTRLRVAAGVDSASDHITYTTNDVRSGLVTSVTDPMGVRVQHTYDNFFRLTQTDKYPVGGSAVWLKQITYSPFGIIASGNAINYAHTKINDGVDAANGVESRTYFDGWGRPIQTRTEAETGNYRVISTAYDERGEGFLTTWPRFENGITFVKPTAQPAAFTGFDAAGRVTETRARVDATFNSNGALSGKSDSTGDANSPLAPKLFAYTNGSDPWWKISTDEDGKVRRYQLDAFGRNKVIQEVDGSTNYLTGFKYNLAGDLTHITNHVGEVISYGHDDLGNVVAMADPHLGYWTYSRDAGGRIREQLDGKGQKIVFTFGATLSRLSTKQVYNSATQLVSTASYSYDSGDAQYTVYKGQLFQTTDSEGWEKSGYDPRGRVQKTTRHLNLNNQDYTTRFTFNDADKITSTIYPNSGPTITNEYHPGGALKRVGRSSYDYYTTAAGNFDEFGKVLQFSFGNSLATTRSNYPVSKRLYTLSTPGVFNREYRYSAAADVSYLSGSGLANTTVTYDNLHRIKTYTGLSGSYNYDPVGNLTTHIESGATTNFAYGSARRQAVKSAFGKNYLYDKCGNMIVRNGGTTNSQALEYNAENRLARFSQVGNVAVEYGYATSGQRLWRRSYVTSTNSPKEQIWIGNLYEEKDGKALFHAFANGQRICTFERDSILNGGSGTSTNYVGYFYHQDHLGSSSVLSDYAGNLKELSVWYPFGRTQTNNPTAAFKVSNRFTGQIQDEETGLYYYNARYYDPELGRFIQPDTIIPDYSNPQSFNRYAYVLNNPLRYIDPTGHEPGDLFTDQPMMTAEAAVAMSKAAAPMMVATTVAVATGGAAAPLLSGAGASTAFTLVGSGMIGGVAGDFAGQTTQIGLGTRSSYSGQEMAVSGLVGGVLNYGVNRLLSPRITTGNIGNAELGAMGEQRAAQEIAQSGGKIRGQQVQFRTPDGNPRVDFVVDDAAAPNGAKGIEVKTGNAKLTYSQENGYPHVQAGAGVPTGRAAAQAGLTRGPMPIEVWRYQPYQFLPFSPSAGSGLGAGATTMGSQTGAEQRQTKSN